MKTIVIGLLFVISIQVMADQRRSQKRRSLIDSDPDVVYVADLLPDRLVELSVTTPTQVYATKRGGRRLGIIEGGKVSLIGFNNRAIKVQGQGKIGWIKPAHVSASKGNIQELMKTVFEREMEVKALIEAGEVALGMNRDEVCRVLGEPTKQSLRRSKEGVSGTMEFIEFEKVDHFSPVFDPFSGTVFRRFTHSTQEEKSKTIIEFEDGVATAIEESEQENERRIRTVTRPIIWFF